MVILAPYLDGTDVSEVGEAYRLIESIQALDATRLTVLSVHRHGRTPLAEQLPGVEVITWNEPRWLRSMGRFNAMTQPMSIYAYWRAGRWLMREIARGRQIDLIHQLLPRAPRYPSPLSGLGIPYIIGPIGGGLSTPDTFRDEGGENWYVNLRRLDNFRLRYDPWLRRGFSGADLVLGVAPYMRKVLEPLQIKKFRPYLGIGVHALPKKFDRDQRSEFKLLYVGRAVRPKGLREAVRAMSLLPDSPRFSLTIIGDGPEIPIAREITRKAKPSAKINFLGRLDREHVQREYYNHDVLLFPSFRESMGAVILEAMACGLPVITVDRGGPGYIVDDNCGIKVSVTNPGQLPIDLAQACVTLAEDPKLYKELSAGALKRATEHLWKSKATIMLEIYREFARTGRQHSFSENESDRQ